MSIRSSVRDLLSRNPTSDALFRRFVWSRLHYPEIEILRIARLPGRPVDLAIDVGAALGSYTWVMGRKARQVLAFEPGVQHFRALKGGTVASNISVVNAAVGRHSGKARMYSVGEGRDADHTATLSEANPLVVADAVHSTEVQLISLDEYLPSSPFAGLSVDILKIDVEGFELDVLMGAKGTLEKHRPLVICEIEARHNPSFADAFGLMESLEYRAMVFSEGGYRRVKASDVPSMQTPDALKERLGGKHGAKFQPLPQQLRLCRAQYQIESGIGD